MTENEITNYLTLSRELFNHPLWEDKPFSKGQAWIDLVQLANFKDKEVIFKGEVITCKRGDVNLSILELSKRWGWSRQTVRRFLDFLEHEKMCTTKCTTHRTTITLINYDKFNIPCATNVTTKRATSGQQVDTTNKDIKEIEKDKSFSTKKVAKKFLTDKPSIPLIDQTEYFIDEDFYNECVKAYPGVDIDKELLGMRVWCIANPKQKKTRRGVTKFINGWLNRAEPTKPVQQKSGVSEALKNFMNRSYMTICGHWQKNHGIDLTKEDALYFRDKMLSLGDENRVKFMVEKFRRNADQDEISDFKEFTDAWLLENGNL